MMQLLLIAAYILFMGLYPSYVKKHYHCSPVSFGRLLGGCVCVIPWIVMLGADKPSFQFFLALGAAIFLFLLLFAANHAVLPNPLQAFLMALWQTMVCFFVICFLVEMCHGNYRKKKDK